MPTTANNSKGLNSVKWSRWRVDLLTRGTYDPERWDELNSYQKQWTKDTLNTIKKFSTNN